MVHPSLAPDVAVLPDGAARALPRAQGTAWLSTKRRDDDSVIDDLRLSGALKCLFPARRGLEAVLLNVSGGLTGGDAFSVTAQAGQNSALTLTTQAAERAYRSLHGDARVDTRLRADAGARLHWLPQETILFEGCALRRSLRVDLAQDAQLLLVEPLIFGRPAMGETLRQARLQDSIHVTRAGQTIYRDRLRLSGDLHAQLQRPAIGGGAGAMASLLYVAPDAEAHLEALRAGLPATGGASLLAPDILVLRLLAEDGFALRQTLLPVLDRLSRNQLPKAWRL